MQDTDNLRTPSFGTKPFRQIILALFLGLCSAALPDRAEARPHVGVEIGGGLIGLEVNAVAKLTNILGLRGGVNRLAPQFLIDGLVNNQVQSTLFQTLCGGSACNNSIFGDPNVEINVETYNGYLDIYPFGGRLRITAGVLFGKKEAVSLFQTQSDAENMGTQITFGNQSITAEHINSIRTEVRLDPYSPYVGIGWNSALGKGSLFGTFINIGAMVVINPQVKIIPTLTSEGAALLDNDLITQAALIEAQRVEDQMRSFPVIPYLSVGVTYRLF